MTSGGEIPDALGWHAAETTLVECKASRADFLADKRKIFRQFPEQGLGNFRYYLAPEGVIKSVAELPEGWGWIVYYPQKGKVRVRVKAEFQKAKHTRKETLILVSLLRRIGQTAPTGVSIHCYTTDIQKKCSLGVAPLE